MEDLALHTFLLGLSPRISNFVRGKDPENLNEAINHATSDEKIQNLVKNTYQNTQNNGRLRFPQSQIRTQNPPISRNTQFQPQNQYRQSTQITCNYCKISGHTINQCRKREHNNRFRANFQHSDPKPNFQQPHFKPQNQYPSI